MKRIICIMLICVMALAASLLPAPGGVRTSEAFIDRANASSEYDPRAAMGEDVLEQLEKASPEARVTYRAGEITVTEPPSRDVSDIEPYIPEGLEIAKPSASVQSIVGGDGDQRSEVTNVNAYPYCAIAYLEITYEDKSTGYGSGAFVGSTVILTAGHVIYDQESGWATSITVYPGGTDSNFNSSTSNSFAAVDGWVNDANFDYDYGVIVIDSSLGTGNFGTKSLSSSNLRNSAIYNYGYPLDKDAGTLWYCPGTIGSVKSRQFLHSADTYGGQSGGPVVQQSDYTYIVGVHSGSYSSSYNAATRVTDSVVSFVKDYLG